MHRGNHLFFENRRALVFVGRCQRIATFRELHQGEVRRIRLPRTSVNKGKRKGRGC